MYIVYVHTLESERQNSVGGGGARERIARVVHYGLEVVRDAQRVHFVGRQLVEVVLLSCNREVCLVAGFIEQEFVVSSYSSIRSTIYWF